MSDSAVLEGLVRLELRGVRVYSGIEETGSLFAEQDREHVAGLSRALRQLGGNPPSEPTAPAGSPSLPEAIELETRTIAAYHDAVGKVRSRDLLPALASILANHAQHVVVLRQALGRNPTPAPFVTGA